MCVCVCVPHGSLNFHWKPEPVPLSKYTTRGHRVEKFLSFFILFNYLCFFCKGLLELIASEKTHNMLFYYKGWVWIELVVKRLNLDMTFCVTYVPLTILYVRCHLTYWVWAVMPWHHKGHFDGGWILCIHLCNLSVECAVLYTVGLYYICLKRNSDMV